MALLLTVGLTAGSAAPALAVDSETPMTITKTNLVAESVINYEGCGALSMSSDQTYEGDDGLTPLQQSALIDAQGQFLFPYTVNPVRHYPYRRQGRGLHLLPTPGSGPGAWLQRRLER